MTVPDDPLIERLVAEAHWVRALAGALVTDGALADDIAQDVLVEALQRPPLRMEGWRAWLGKVTRAPGGHGRVSGYPAGTVSVFRFARRNRA